MEGNAVSQGEDNTLSPGLETESEIKYTLSIVNIVGVGHPLGDIIPLRETDTRWEELQKDKKFEEVQERMERQGYTVFKPEKFPNLWGRKEGELTIGIFPKNGDAIIPGCKDYSQIEGSRRDLYEIMDVEYSVKVTNIVASMDVGRKIDIEALTFNCENYAYDPEVFPGGMYKPFGDGRTALIFYNGKINLVGCASCAELDEFAQKIESKVSPCYVQYDFQ